MTLRTDRLRVAIVGLGPKGLFALERLLGKAQPGARLSVDIFEPHPVPGAGPVYDPSQPDYLRMNFAAEAVDMWWRDGVSTERPTFVEWRRSRGGGDEPYPPRAEVGSYLSGGFARLKREAPEGVALRMREIRVDAIGRVASMWRIVDELGDADDFDEVLIATGHVGGGQVFPVDRWLTRERIAPGDVVAMRGFALTFLDAALALTEGRGGRFEPAPGAGNDLRYLASGEEPRLILPFSRTGRPILPKPDPGLMGERPGLEAIALAGREAIAVLPEDLHLEADLPPILAASAAASLGELDAGGDESEREAFAWLATACHGSTPATTDSPAAEIRRSLGIGTGSRAPDVTWALGHTWRTLYPAIVERFGGDGLSESEWPTFRRLAVQMERIAFGPPPINAAKLLALIEAGVVDPGWARETPVGRSGAARLGPHEVDRVVDAVLPEPGALGTAGPLPRLLADGHARVIPGRRGLEVDGEATCIGADGAPAQGLAAIGRPTEDCVIGNDTLNRELHPQVDRWARRVIGRGMDAPPAANVRAPVAWSL